jgi:hypothetical protein
MKIMDQWNGQQRAVAIKMFYMFGFFKSSPFLGHPVYTSVPFRRPRQRQEKNIKMDLQEVGCGVWIG